MADSGEPLRLAVANDVSEMGRVEGAVVRFLETRCVPEKTAYAARVVVEEILMNSIGYGCADGGRHEILVELRVDSDGIDLRFEDDGREFDPRSAATTRSDASLPLAARRAGGVGLKLVGAIANRFEYRRAEGRNIVEIRVSEVWGPRA